MVKGSTKGVRPADNLVHRPSEASVSMGKVRLTGGRFEIGWLSERPAALPSAGEMEGEGDCCLTNQRGEEALTRAGGFRREKHPFG